MPGPSLLLRAGCYDYLASQGACGVFYDAFNGLISPLHNNDAVAHLMSSADLVYVGNASCPLSRSVARSAHRNSKLYVAAPGIARILQQMALTGIN